MAGNNVIYLHSDLCCINISLGEARADLRVSPITLLAKKR